MTSLSLEHFKFGFWFFFNLFKNYFFIMYSAIPKRVASQPFVFVFVMLRSILCVGRHKSKVMEECRGSWKDVGVLICWQAEELD